ncbi:cobalamin B12-binding domain-containing protein [Actinopolymorpha sp. B17G11]|uniref:cobalamin B12-binding domain-containing protein n=1 Tax=unclassified Actinopolymorpha TaxID=2627063 RepID=UPI0032D9866B
MTGAETTSSPSAADDANPDAEPHDVQPDTAANDGRTSRAPIRIVVAKPGLDGHDRGAKVVARALRDAGMEVIYTGLHQTPEQIVETALQEDADGIGLSVLSGAHMTLFRTLMQLLRDRGADDIVVFGGGIIPEADIEALAELGVARVFTPGTSTHEIVRWVREHVAEATEYAGGSGATS